MPTPFIYSQDTLDMAKAALQAVHPDAKLYIDEDEDPSITRFELSLPSMNKILSNRYWGPKSGFALGKLYNFWGPESSGKSALALMITGDILNAGGKAAWDDAERSFDSDYCELAFGIDARDPNFHLILPDYGEQAFDAAQIYAESGALSLITIDSVSALGTKRTQDNEAEKSDVASLALKLAQHLQRVVKPANDNKTSIIYINQMRENLISMGGMLMAAGKKHTGGNAMKFYPHVGLKFEKGKEILTADKEFVGIEVTIEGNKNKVSRPKVKSSFVLVPGEGFSRELDILDLAAAVGVVQKQGNYYYFGAQTVGNGQNQARLKMKENPDMTEEIWTVTKPFLEPELALSMGMPTADLKALQAAREESKKKSTKKPKQAA